MPDHERRRRGRRRALFAAIGVSVIAGAMLLAVIGRDAGDQAPPAISAAASPAQSLASARRDYRERFFDPYAHLRLEEALYRGGRQVDSFYVLETTRALFPAEVFGRAHAHVVLSKGKSGWPGDAPFDPSPESEARWRARLAQDPGDWKALSYLAHIEGSRGGLDEGLRLIDRGLALKPEEPMMLGFRAEALRQKGAAPADVLEAFAAAYKAAPRGIDGRAALTYFASLAGSKGELAGAALARLREAAAERGDPTAFSLLAGVQGVSSDATRALVDEALKADPAHPGASFVEALIAIERRDFETALTRLGKAGKDDPEDPNLLRALALTLLRLKKFDEALPVLIALHRQSPDEELAGGRVSDAVNELLKARREKALEGATTLARLRPFFEDADGSLRAQACLVAARLDDARALPALVGLLDDDDGNVLQDADHAIFELAKTHRGEVLALREPLLKSPSVFARGRGFDLFADLAPDETLPALEAAAAGSDAYLRFAAVGALRAYYQGNERAQRAARASLAAEKDAGLRAVYEKLGIKDEEGGALEALIAKDPIKGGLVQAALLAERKDHAGAVKRYLEVLEAARGTKALTAVDYGAIYSALGGSYLALDDGARAEGVLRQAVKLNAKSPTAASDYYNLACALSMNGKLAEARRCWKGCLRAAARTPGRADYFRKLAQSDAQLARLRKMKGGL